MKLIKPSEISARILTLLDESDERVVIVSPYMKISKWYKFLNKFNRLKSRGILTEIYIRDDPDNVATYVDLDQLALEYKKVPHLHCKFYLNEKYGIISSMNLLLSSEFNSLEIGYATETWMEYNEVLAYYHRYIHVGEPLRSNTIAGQKAADLKEIMYEIREALRGSAKNAWLWFAENTLHISTGRNNYRISINKGSLRITTCLKIASSTKQIGILACSTNQKSNQCHSLIAKKVADLTAMKVDMLPGQRPEILQLSGLAQNLMKSTCIPGILQEDAAYMIESVIRFVEATDDLETSDSSNCPSV